MLTVRVFNSISHTRHAIDEVEEFAYDVAMDTEHPDVERLVGAAGEKEQSAPHIPGRINVARTPSEANCVESVSGEVSALSLGRHVDGAAKEARATMGMLIKGTMRAAARRESVRSRRAPGGREERPSTGTCAGEITVSEMKGRWELPRSLPSQSLRSGGRKSGAEVPRARMRRALEAGKATRR